MALPQRVLIAPLNWGLGHAVRCLPIAEAFRELGFEIHWASDGIALDLLIAECPEEPAHRLPSYGIRYPTSLPVVNMALSGPSMLQAVLREKAVTARLHEKFNYTLIVSDNRYGVQHAGVRSAIICHQLHLPLKNQLAARVGNLLNHYWLRRFDEVWIPDYEIPPRLAGRMSAPLVGQDCFYFGPASRFSGQGPGTLANNSVLIVLSGPEPSRTKFEQRLLQQAQDLNEYQIILVRGLPGKSNVLQNQPAHVTVYNFLTTDELKHYLLTSQTIISRPGYTTIMDLRVLNRKAIYVPTPGQPEQEGLGESLAMAGVGVCVNEANLVLEDAIKSLRELPETVSPAKGIILKDWIANRIESVLN